MTLIDAAWIAPAILDVPLCVPCIVFCTGVSTRNVHRALSEIRVALQVATRLPCRRCLTVSRTFWIKAPRSGWVKAPRSGVAA